MLLKIKFLNFTYYRTYTPKNTSNILTKTRHVLVKAKEEPRIDNEFTQLHALHSEIVNHPNYLKCLFTRVTCKIFL